MSAITAFFGILVSRLGICALVACTTACETAAVAEHTDDPPYARTLDAASRARILALDPERISDAEVRDVLARAPAPRILCFQGSPAIVTMAPFAEFLIAMGYPAARLRNPRDGALSYSSHAESREVAGTLGWYYEHEGMVPMLIGHSRGGLIVIRVLYRLADTQGEPIAVWNPLTGQAEARTTVRDPLSGIERSVAGLKVPYAAVLATGKLPRIMLGQWQDLPRLRKVPDSVEEFTGFQIAWDPIAGTLGAAEPYQALGPAVVRNVTLPGTTSHIALPRTAHLAANPTTRAWISAYSPSSGSPPLPLAPGVETSNLLHAADIWHSVKKHWCLEAQRVVRAEERMAAREK